jgi:glycosyltransferase involved in cell wall biosynthesis
MGKFKVAVYTICKNEENQIERWMGAVKEADLIMVCDTGSTDKSVELLREKGAIVNRIEVVPWRFDAARNKALSFLPEDVDICVSVDLDEVFDPGWREKLENIWTETTTRAKYSYTCLFYSDGSKGPTFLFNKIHNRFGYQWIKPVHEELEYIGEGEEQIVIDSTIQLNHYQDITKSRFQYLPLLELSVEESPNEDRNVHYLGREYMFHGQNEKAIQMLKRHLSLESARWEEERAASMRFIARCYLALNNEVEARQWLYRAIGEAPNQREPYGEMARFAYQNKEYLLAVCMVEEALNIKVKPGHYLDEKFCWDETLYDIGGVSAFYAGLMEKALELTKNAMELAPDDLRIQNNYRLIQNNLVKIK